MISTKQTLYSMHIFSWKMSRAQRWFPVHYHYNWFWGLAPRIQHSRVTVTNQLCVPKQFVCKEKLIATGIHHPYYIILYWILNLRLTWEYVFWLFDWKKCKVIQLFKIRTKQINYRTRNPLKHVIFLPKMLLKGISLKYVLQ